MSDPEPWKAAQMILAVALGEPPMPGDFFRLLVEAGFHADPSNRAALRRGWPNLGAALDLYKDVDGGTEQLRQRRDDHYAQSNQ